MSNIVKADEASGKLMEQVLIGGDLSKLNPQDRVMYYTKVCESVGLNPLTKPFEYISLNGKLTLYAKRDCTDQLRSINGVSITIVSREVVDDCYVVTARATDRRGRNDESIGAVPIANLKGEAKSNAFMKAETKAKRRVTLSVCGLGMLDETEISSIPGAVYPQPTAITPTSGAAERVDSARVAQIDELAVRMQEFCGSQQYEDAILEAENFGLDADEKVYLWTQFDAPTRRELKKASDAIKAKYAATVVETQPVKEEKKISDAQRKRLEARIGELKLDREAIKLKCMEDYGREHFSDLTPSEYEVISKYVDDHDDFIKGLETAERNAL